MKHSRDAGWKLQGTVRRTNLGSPVSIVPIWVRQGGGWAEGVGHLLLAGFVSVLCRAVQVVAEATGLHAAPVLHEVGFGAAATRVGARPLKARQRRETDKISEQLARWAVWPAWLVTRTWIYYFKSHHFVLCFPSHSVGKKQNTTHSPFKLNPFAKTIKCPREEAAAVSPACVRVAPGRDCLWQAFWESRQESWRRTAFLWHLLEHYPVGPREWRLTPGQQAPNQSQRNKPQDGGHDTSTGGTEAVTGLAVVAIEVLAVLAGDGALGPLQAEDRHTDAVIEAMRSWRPGSPCNAAAPPRDPWLGQASKQGKSPRTPSVLLPDAYPASLRLWWCLKPVCVLRAPWTVLSIVRLAGASLLCSAPWLPPPPPWGCLKGSYSQNSLPSNTSDNSDSQPYDVINLKVVLL